MSSNNRDKKKSFHTNNKWRINKLHEEPSPSKHMYEYGIKDAGSVYTKTTEVLEEYVGIEYGKAARQLMLGKDNPPEEPKLPAGRDGKDPSAAAMKRHEIDRSYWNKKKERSVWRPKPRSTSPSSITVPSP